MTWKGKKKGEKTHIWHRRHKEKKKKKLAYEIEDTITPP
jgi:hypothetical protein